MVTIFPAIKSRIHLLMACISVLCIYNHTICASGSNYGSINAENDLLEYRLDYPDAFFLLDGYNAVVIEDDFFFGPEENSGGIWSDKLLKSAEWRGFPDEDSHIKGIFSAFAGNETGDPHLQELTGKKIASNRTPFMHGYIFNSPLPSWKLWSSFDQNDHFSYRLSGLRASIIRNSSTAWFGDNIPPRSVISSGILYSADNIMSGGFIDRGWQWIHSPLTGIPYPWKGSNISLKSSFHDYLELDYYYGNWEPLFLNNPGMSLKYWKASITAKAETHGKNSDFKWSMNSGVRSRSRFSAPENDNSPHPWLSVPARTSFPLRVSAEGHIVLNDSTLIIISSGNAAYEHYLPSAKAGIKISKSFFSGYIWQEMNFYHWNPHGFRSFAQEHIPGIDSGISETELNKNLTGIKISAGYIKKIYGTELSLSSAVSLEESVPFFSADTFITLGTFSLRSGSLDLSPEPIAQAITNASIHIPLPFGFSGSCMGRYRYLMDDLYIDYVPSPYFMGITLGKNTLSNLHITLKSNFIGPKKVKNWNRTGDIFEIDSHWEHNLSLAQTFLDDRLRLHYTALHAFGDEVLEHPVGNPLRFRIIAGADFRF